MVTNKDNRRKVSFPGFFHCNECKYMCYCDGTDITFFRGINPLDGICPYCFGADNIFVSAKRKEHE